MSIKIILAAFVIQSFSYDRLAIDSQGATEDIAKIIDLEPRV